MGDLCPSPLCEESMSGERGCAGWTRELHSWGLVSLQLSGSSQCKNWEGVVLHLVGGSCLISTSVCRLKNTQVSDFVLFPAYLGFLFTLYLLICVMNLSIKMYLISYWTAFQTWLWQKSFEKMSVNAFGCREGILIFKSRKVISSVVI